MLLHHWSGRMRLLRVAGVAAILAGFVAVGQTAAQTIMFKFNPPDGAQFVETVKRTRTTRQEPGKKQVDVTVSKSKTEIKKTPTGYTMVVTPVSFEATRDGKKIDGDTGSALDNALRTSTLTYELDKNGRFVGVSGFDDKNVSADLKAMAVTRAKNDYNSRIGNLIGRKVKPGQGWQTAITSSLFSLPGSESITLNQKAKFVGLQKCAGRNCAKVRSDYSADPAKLKASLQKMFSGVASTSKEPRPTSKVLSSSLSGNAERLIDPQTLLIYSEKSSRKFSIVLESPKKVKASGGFDETRETTFDYTGIGDR